MDGTKLKWAAVEFCLAPEHEDLAGWLVMHCGASGCQMSPGDDGALIVHANFDKPELSEKDIERLKSSFELYGLGACLASLVVKTVAEEDWLAEWKRGFQPFAVGERLLVSPPWLRDSLEPGQVGERKVIFIEPGMAFGTGLHATTRYCLQALERQVDGSDIADIGTGTGILAIGAALVFPQARIWAVDVDPVSIKVAKENIALNQVAGRIELIEGSCEVLDDQAFDCLLSNLTCEDICALLVDYLRILRPGGTVICAGILKEKLPQLEAAIASYPLSIVDRVVDDMWAGVTMTRVPVVLSPR